MPELTQLLGVGEEQSVDVLVWSMFRSVAVAGLQVVAEDGQIQKRLLHPAAVKDMLRAVHPAGQTAEKLAELAASADALLERLVRMLFGKETQTPAEQILPLHLANQQTADRQRGRGGSGLRGGRLLLGGFGDNASAALGSDPVPYVGEYFWRKIILHKNLLRGGFVSRRAYGLRNSL